MRFLSFSVSVAHGFEPIKGFAPKIDTFGALSAASRSSLPRNACRGTIHWSPAKTLRCRPIFAAAAR